jgi:hypothetical protein
VFYQLSYIIFVSCTCHLLVLFGFELILLVKCYIAIRNSKWQPALIRQRSVVVKASCRYIQQLRLDDDDDDDEPASRVD